MRNIVIVSGEGVFGMCLKGKKTAPEKPGNFRCQKCGATSKKKKELCKGKKIK